LCPDFWQKFEDDLSVSNDFSNISNFSYATPTLSADEICPIYKEPQNSNNESHKNKRLKLLPQEKPLTIHEINNEAISWETRYDEVKKRKRCS